MLISVPAPFHNPFCPRNFCNKPVSSRERNARFVCSTVSFALKRPVILKKQHLPEKTCPACGRPFRWRKKWEKVWEEVKYCSDRCRMNKHRKK
jgi:hypothetical protein